jgi:chromosome segregation ATPase
MRDTIPPPPRRPNFEQTARLDLVLEKLEDLRVSVARLEERLANEGEDLDEVKKKVEVVATDISGLKAKAAVIAALATGLMNLLPELMKLLGH